MPKVFVVTIGEYSDYRICGVFSSREKAEEICPAVKDESGGARIEEYDLNVNTEAEDEEILQNIHTVYLNISDGSVSRDFNTDYIQAEMVPRDYSSGTKCFNYDVVVGRSVVSREHAHKVAVEARQAYLREKANQPATD